MVEQSESERMLDPVARSTSALSRNGRPGLMKSFSLSTPNVAGMLDAENAILDRIRDLELQIHGQQVQHWSDKLPVPPFQFSGYNFLSAEADI